MRWLFALSALVLLVACGGPSESDLQATVGAAVQATTQAGQIATSVKATQEAAACGKEQMAAYADAMEGQIRAFEEQSQLVGSTPRVSLGAPLQRLLDIQTETRKVQVPNCLKDFQDRVIKAMQLHQIAYQMFAGQQGSDAVINTTLEIATKEFTDIKRDLGVIRGGTVPPNPTPAITPTP
jgi:hypothetical protein